VDFATYSKLEAVNWSSLKEMRRSPRHYQHRLTAPREDTKAMALGRATHTATRQSGSGRRVGGQRGARLADQRESPHQRFAVHRGAREVEPGTGALDDA